MLSLIGVDIVLTHCHLYEILNPSVANPLF